MRNETIHYFKHRFKSKPEIFAFAPGRLEILGNHTDYNEGFVLSTAVNLGTYIACKKIDGDICEISVDVKDLNNDRERKFDINKLKNEKKGDWANYIKGVIVELQKRGYKIPAFQMAITSTIPLSAGMSSSASLEMATSFALAKLIKRYVDNKILAKISKAEWAKIGQACENNFIGANTGLLDQFSSVMGKKDQLVFSDFRTLDVKNFPLAKDITMVVANTLVKHDLTAEYGERRASCESAAKFFKSKNAKKTHLRDVSSAELEAAKTDLDKIFYMRAKHVIGEDERVLAGVKLLENGEIEKFGKLMDESHASSINFFENSCPELDVLVSEGQKLKGHIGARLSGGGFGGISVHFVKNQDAENYQEQLKIAYKNKTGKEAETVSCVSGSGATAEFLN